MKMSYKTARLVMKAASYARVGFFLPHSVMASEPANASYITENTMKLSLKAISLQYAARYPVL